MFHGPSAPGWRSRTWLANQNGSSRWSSTPAIVDHLVHRRHGSAGVGGRIRCVGSCGNRAVRSLREAGGHGNPGRPRPGRSVTPRSLQAVQDLAFITDTQGRGRLTPEGPYERRKMLVAVRNTGIPATPGAVDHAMRALGLNRSSVEPQPSLHPIHPPNAE